LRGPADCFSPAGYWWRQGCSLFAICLGGKSCHGLAFPEACARQAGAVAHSGSGIIAGGQWQGIKLVPMVTETEEYRQCISVIAREVERLERSGIKAPEKLELGAMIEVPSILFELDELLELTDFISIGSNDLIQFLTASDRANTRVAGSYDPIGVPRLRAIKMIVDAAKRHDIPLTMCGELAGRPIEALALMAIGMSALSMGPSSVGPVKDLVLNLDLAPIREEVNKVLNGQIKGQDMRDLLTQLADKQNLPL